MEHSILKSLRKMKAFIGEGTGTFVLTLFGCGSVAVALLFGAYSGIFQVG